MAAPASDFGVKNIGVIRRMIPDGQIEPWTPDAALEFLWWVSLFCTTTKTCIHLFELCNFSMVYFFFSSWDSAPFLYYSVLHHSEEFIGCFCTVKIRPVVFFHGWWGTFSFSVILLIVVSPILGCTVWHFKTLTFQHAEVSWQSHN